jgi:hypothetical protein
MGTWGTGIFEDDSACDFVDDIMADADPLSTIEDKLLRAAESEYLEADLGTEAVVSAALIDVLLNGTHYHYGEGSILSWAQSNQHLNALELRAHAVKALQAVLTDNSELNELWHENEEEYPNWRQNIVELMERLK